MSNKMLTAEEEAEESNENLEKAIIYSWLEKVKSIIQIDEIIDLSSELLSLKIIKPLRHEQILHDAKQSPGETIKDICEIIRRPKLEILCNAIAKIESLKLCECMLDAKREHKYPINATDSQPTNVPVIPVFGHYLISSQKRGHVLIINNYEFTDKKLQFRSGANVDVKKLQRVLEDLNYVVILRENMTKEEMIDEIEEFVERPEHDSCDAVGMVIMSHGLEEIIYDINKKECPIRDILSPFTKKTSPVFNKPKFIIFQSCRGLNKHNNFVSPISQFFKSSEYDNDPSGSDKSDLTVVSHSVVIEEISLPHSIIMYAALPSFMTIRDPIDGTLFIQAICETLEKHGKDTPCHKLFLLIADKSNEFIRRYDKQEYVLVPQVELHLTKNFYLDTALKDNENSAY